jgi:hypothetical protein
MSCITQCNAFRQASEPQSDWLKAVVANLERSACLAGQLCSIPATDLDDVICTNITISCSFDPWPSSHTESAEQRRPGARRSETDEN